MRLISAGWAGTGQALLDTGLRTLEIVVQDGVVRLYAATAATGGITAWELAPGTPPREIDRQYFASWMQDDITGLAGLRVQDGTVELVLGTIAGSQVLAYGTDAAGRIGPLRDIATLTIEAGRIVDMAGGDTLYMADVGQGRLLAPGNTGAADFAISGDALLAMAQVGAREILLMAEPGRQGVASFEIDPASGALRPLDGIGLEEGLGIGTPTALETVRAHGQTWVLVAAAESGSISVLRLDPGGGLTPTDHIVDTRTTRFDQAQDLAVVEAGGRVFVVAGGGDDGLTLMTLLPDGRLLHLQTIAHEEGLGLMDVSAIAAALVGDEIQIAVGSEESAGLALFTVPLDTLGTVRTGTGTLTGGTGDDLLAAETVTDTLRGGEGADILVGGRVQTGGAGGDIFVPDYAAGTTRITDFEPGLDRLDLSDFPMLRGPDQLDIRATATGARITYRDAVVEITSAHGGPIQPGALFGPAFDWADRMLVLGAQGGVVMRGTPSGEFLGGTERGDTIEGEGGADSIWTRGGDDVISGGDGADSLGGQDGDDTLLGEEGNDMLAGGRGRDFLRGGNGNDALWGADDNDTLAGEAGRDTLGGGNGNDELSGGDGVDELWGGRGHDRMSGGADNDMLGGYTGDDTLYGEGGDDELWGADGADHLQGGEGNDMAGGGAGNDRVLGEGGDDLLFGGPGLDTVLGGHGNDAVYGAAGDDQLMGGAGNDSLWGGGGDDWMSGGAGADVFLFAARSGTERIADFEAGLDRIHIYDPGLDYASLRMEQVGADVRILLTEGSITLSGLQLDDLSEEDFSFGW